LRFPSGLWRGNHVGIKQVTEDFARYVYLRRLAEPAVFFSAIRDGVGLLTWEKDSFAYADDFDEKAGRYRGLRHGQLASLSPDAPTGLLVRPEIAMQQLELETKPPTASTEGKRPEKKPPLAFPLCASPCKEKSRDIATLNRASVLKLNRELLKRLANSGTRPFVSERKSLLEP
jgi:hypothetical protein